MIDAITTQYCKGAGQNWEQQCEIFKGDIYMEAQVCYNYKIHNPVRILFIASCPQLQIQVLLPSNK